MSGRYTGRAVLVTGAGSGIGRATARRLAFEGADVGLLSLSPEQVNAAAKDIEKTGRSCLPLVCDVADPDAVAAAFTAFDRWASRLDLLVTAAGTTQNSRFLDETEAYWAKIVSVNLMGTLRACFFAAQRMGEGGAIVTVASDAGRVGTAGEAVYSAAKGGVLGFTRSLARELSGRVRVNAVSPGVIDTGLTRAMRADPAQRQLVEKVERRIPMRRTGTAEEVAALIAFLGSDEASYITGQTYSINGGLTMTP